MNIHSILRPFLTYFRTKRMRQFRHLFGLTPETRILDVGGYEFNWMLLPFSPCVTLLNLSVPRERVTLPWLLRMASTFLSRMVPLIWFTVTPSLSIWEVLRTSSCLPRNVSAWGMATMCKPPINCSSWNPILLPPLFIGCLAEFRGCFCEILQSGVGLPVQAADIANLL